MVSHKTVTHVQLGHYYRAGQVDSIITENLTDLLLPEHLSILWQNDDVKT